MICYLDNSATTRPTEAVADAMRQCMLEGFYNPSALYAPAVDSEKRLTACREAIARELHADPARVVFTSGGTEADNLAVKGTVLARPARTEGADGWAVALRLPAPVAEAVAAAQADGPEVRLLGREGAA